MHGPVDVVEQVERLADQLVSLFEEALLDLRLAGRVEVVRVGGARVRVLHDRKGVEDVLFEEGLARLPVQAVFPEEDLDPHFQAKGPAGKR